MNEALAYIDKSLDNLADLDPETAWKNVKVVSVVRGVGVIGCSPGQHVDQHVADPSVRASWVVRDVLSIEPREMVA